MKVFEYAPSDSPRDAGRAHGEMFRGMIQELAEIRIGLALSIGRFRDREELLRIAREHLPILASFDPALHAELAGIAEGASLGEEEVVVLNHYTDLRDIDPESLGPKIGRPTLPVPDLLDGNEEGCSAVYASAAGSQENKAGLLAQTWDMHGSAEPYVMMLGIPEMTLEGGHVQPAAWSFTVTGCLGMTGLNQHGIGVTINNLRSVDARLGVVWPAFVRRVLRTRSVGEAKSLAMSAPIGSGHHYLVAGPTGVFGLETSGVLREIAYQGEKPVYVHTNHCLLERVRERTRIPESSTTHERYRRLLRLENEEELDSDRLWKELGSHEGYPRSVCSHLAGPDMPHGSKTCGGLLMDLKNRSLLAAGGCLCAARPHVFDFDGGA